MTLQKVSDKLREQGLHYPETYEEAPWGERVLKVNNKIFLFAGLSSDKLHVTVHLPHSGFTVLAAPFAAPAGYGLARSGWVSLTFETARDVPMADLLQWLDESYRTIAPKRLLKGLPTQGPPPPVADDTPPPDIWASVTVASDDPLRAERSARAFRKLGVDAVLCGPPRPELLENLVSTTPAVLVIDLGRRAAAGIELAQAALEACPSLSVTFAGVRDAKMEKQASSQVPSARTFRLAPGDAGFVDAVASGLSS